MSGAAPVVGLSRSASVRGKTVFARGRERKPVHAFLGIPYAEPPVGELRFRAPVSRRLWQGERDCTKFGAICPQHREVLAFQIQPVPVPAMSEDCLHLNVWTPTLDTAAKLPVMLWIHGGAFVTGLSDVYDGTCLAAYQNVVFISINYRLASLGFMSTGDSASPGNYGLLDQVESMRWTRKYISNFGGDTENVTIFGESAGGISVSFHMLSDLSKNLFRRGILQSGVTCFPGDVWSGAQAKKYISKRAQMLGVNTSSSEELVDQLRRLPVEDLIKLGEGFSPVVDGVFIKDSPRSLYHNKQFQAKACILGFNSDEGATFVFPSLGTTSVDSLQEARDYIKKVVKTSLFRGNINADVISRLAAEEYLHGLRDGDALGITRALVDFHGELLFVAPIINLAQMHSASAKTYLYLFNKRPSISQLPEWIRADHSQEIFYALGVPFNPRIKEATFNAADREVSKIMMQYWADFARSGDPNGNNEVTWPCFDVTSGERYLVIGDHVHTACRHKEKRIQFWNKTIGELRQTASKY